MLIKRENIQSKMILYTMEELVPEDSLFRKIDKYIDCSFIYDEVKDLYCAMNGKPCIDPVVLFKLIFIQALDGLKSMRKTCEKIKVDADNTPHNLKNNKILTIFSEYFIKFSFA